jgi:hypothetical protein
MAVSMVRYLQWILAPLLLLSIVRHLSGLSGLFDETPPLKAPPLASIIPAEALRSYGFTPCPWMPLPAQMRYPRMPPKERLALTMWQCLEKLTAMQNNGDIVFVLMEGQGLAAQMVGGFHGNTDDGDVDMQVFSRTNATMKEHYDWCNGNTPIGNYGFFPLESDVTKLGSSRLAAFKAQVAANHQESVNSSRVNFNSRYCRENRCNDRELVFLKDLAVENYCIGQYEEFEVLLPHPALHYFRELHGGSYWVPPLQGGKSIGRWFVDYMNPKDGLFAYPEWLVEFHDGLNMIDTDHNEDISVAEFLTYCRTNSRINQKRLDGALQMQPCVVANALIHYQWTMKYRWIARRDRGACASASNEAACHAQNWVHYKEMWGSGPAYFEIDARCRQIIQADDRN